jgi:hypothetical protein
MVNVGIFYDHLEYFKAIWYNLWPFGNVCGHLSYYSHFGMFGPIKIWQPCYGSYKKRKGTLCKRFENTTLQFYNFTTQLFSFAQPQRKCWFRHKLYHEN